MKEFVEKYIIWQNDSFENLRQFLRNMALAYE